jgi:hypothetical protein
MKGKTTSPLFFNFALEYAITKVQVNQVGLKMNGTHQLLAYADDVNLLGDNINTRKKNTETLINASKKVHLEINIRKSKHILLSRHQNVGQNRDIKTAIGKVSQFKQHTSSMLPPFLCRRAWRASRISKMAASPQYFRDCVHHLIAMDNVLPSTFTCCFVIKFEINWQPFATKNVSFDGTIEEHRFMMSTASCNCD